MGTALGILTFGLTSYQPLWDLVHASGNVQATLGVGLSILIVLLGFLFALYFQQADFQDQLCQAIPSLTLFTLSSGDEAMQRVAQLFSTARVALNTRVFSGEFNPTTNPGHSFWDERLRAAVKGGLTFKEVVSAGNLALAQDRKQATAGGRGLYDAVVVNCQFDSFMNFVILEFPDGTKELWFGWLISQGAGFEQHVVHTTERQIVQMFETWHRDLYSSGQSPWPQQQTASLTQA